MFITSLSENYILCYVVIIGYVEKKEGKQKISKILCIDLVYNFMYINFTATNNIKIG